MLARPFSGAKRGGREKRDLLVEEPLEIRFDSETVATTMRTPGNDFELATGWCWAEGLLRKSPEEVRYCATGSAVETEFNVVSVDSADGSQSPSDSRATPPPRLSMATSSCGICGAEQIRDLFERLDPIDPPGLRISELVGLSAHVVHRQQLFDSTGGAHGAAAFFDGEVAVLREDIGRHNAVDKVVGRLLLDDSIPAVGGVLWVSGRSSLEIVQKAWAAGFGALVSVGAVSSMAVEVAERAGMVLAGFARGDDVTLYAGEEHVRS